MNDELTLDYLPHHDDIKVYQSKTMFRINTDTHLLGEFITVRKNDRILDIGTNNGALLLYASVQGRPCELTGIDINEGAIEIAKKNLELNGLTGNVFVQDAKTFYNPDQYDLIICNPPYFNTKNQTLKNKNTLVKDARHEDEFSIKDMMRCFKRNLKDNGRFYICHRANRINDIFKEMSEVGMRASKLQLVYDKDKSEAIAVLIEGRRSKIAECLVMEPKIIER